MMKIRTVYFAARYHRRPELLEYATEAEAKGIVVTSRWLNGSHSPGESFTKTQLDAFWTQIAKDDLSDVMEADALVYFSEPEGAERGGGGHNVELGLAVAASKRVVLVGRRENPFHWHPSVYQVPDWASALGMLLATA